MWYYSKYGHNIHYVVHNILNHGPDYLFPVSNYMFQCYKAITANIVHKMINFRS